jgi:hypothetical protein
MKVQLSGKEYVSNLVGLGFEPMLPHFFLSIIYARWRWTWRAHVVEGQGWWAHVEEARGGGGQPTG